MANSGPSDNSSQFFFTLGATKELQNKNTVFGKVVGDTLYNLPRFEEGEIGKDDRPVYPHKIIKCEVLLNPFTDIVPREAIQNEIPKEERKKSKKKGIKNFSLLSFGGEAEEDEEEVVSATKALEKVKRKKSQEEKKEEAPLSAAMGTDKQAAKDRIKDRLKKLAGSSDNSKENELEEDKCVADSQLDHASGHHHKKKKHSKDSPDRKADTSKRTREDETSDSSAKRRRKSDAEESQQKTDSAEKLPGHEEKNLMEKEKPKSREDESSEKKQKRDEVKAEIKSLQKELYGKKKTTDSKTSAQKEDNEKEEKEKPSDDPIDKFLKEKEKYMNRQQTLKKGTGREDFTLSMFKRFNKKMKGAIHGELTVTKEDDWLTEKVIYDDTIPVLAKDANTKDDSWYGLDDPRNPLNKKKREESSRRKK